MMSDSGCPFCQKLRHLDSLPEDEVVWRFDESVALLGPWQFYQGYCLLVSRTHATELHHLDAERRQRYFDELCQVSAAIEAAFRPRKLNCESLGNQVPHLHWHVIPRYPHDPDHLQPVWLALDRAQRDADKRERLQTAPLSRAAIAAALRAQLATTS
jgi:diadenosine tetraphosphate (Ap4A) HIT family hydrolase